MEMFCDGCHGTEKHFFPNADLCASIDQTLLEDEVMKRIICLLAALLLVMSGFGPGGCDAADRVRFAGPDRVFSLRAAGGHRHVPGRRTLFHLAAAAAEEAPK